MKIVTQNTEKNDNSLYLFADAYARHVNIPIFPLKPRSKLPITKHGFKDASKDPQIIFDWWKGNPFANIGCVTGTSSGIVVLDIDPKPNAEVILREFEQKFGKLPLTPTANSGGGGLHFFFKSNAPLPCRVKMLHGIDFRADGGYIVLPPSIHESGQRYVWKTGLHINDLPFAVIPDWLVDLVKNSSESKGGFGNGFFKNVTDDSIEEGYRTSTMTSVIGHLLARHVDMKLLKALVLSFNQVKFVPPLQEKEVLKILDSIAKRELQKYTKEISK